MKISSIMGRVTRALKHLWNLATDDDYCLLADLLAEPVPGMTWVGAAESRAALLTDQLNGAEPQRRPAPLRGHHGRSQSDGQSQTTPVAQ